MVRLKDLNANFKEEDDTCKCWSTEAENPKHYEVSSVAHFCDVNEPVAVKSRTYSQGLYIFLGKTLILYDVAEKKEKLLLSFPSSIDVCCMNEDESVLAVGLRDGEFRCISVDSGNAIYKSQLEVTGSNVMSTFVGLHAESGNNFILLCRNGKILRITVAPEHNLQPEQKFSEGSSQTLWDLKSEVYSSCFFKRHYGSPVLFISSAGEFFLHDDSLELVTLIYPEKGNRITKIQITKEGSILVCLAGSKIVFYCAFTWMLLKVFDEQGVVDFSLAENVEDDEQFLVNFVDSDGNYLVKLLIFSGASCTLQISASCPYLPDLPLLLDGLVLLDTKSNCGDNVEEVVVKFVSESNPSNRLAQLLRKRLFKEAEIFAYNYGLDFQDIYKAQSVNYVNMLEDRDIYSDSNFEYDSLMSNLQKIKDVVFVVNVCTGAVLPKLDMVKALLLYSRDRLQESVEKENADVDKLVKGVKEQLYLFDTFSLLRKHDKNASWASFSKENILELFCNSLRQGAWREAWIMWIRHWDQCVEFFKSADDAVIILEKLPHGVFHQDVYTILESYTDKVLHRFANAPEHFAKWAISKILSLESLQNWLTEALFFCEKMLKYLIRSKNFGDYSVLAKNVKSEEFMVNWPSVNSLHNILGSLKDIQYFESEFGVRIKLSEYDRENKECLVKILLWKISLKDYDKLISAYLMKYFAEFHLDLNATLMNNVEELLSCSTSTLSEEYDVCERKAIALTEYIKDIEKKGNCILMIMNTSPFPWNEKVSELVRLGAALEHPISETITRQISYMKGISMMKKYNLGKCHLIHDFNLIIRHIIQKNQPDMLEDCLCVAFSESQKNEVYTSCVRHHFQRREYEKGFELLESLPNKTRLDILERMVHWIHAETLVSGGVDGNINYADLLNLIKLHMKDILKESDEGEYLLEEIPFKELRGHYYVKENFGVNLCLDEAQLNKDTSQKILSKLTENVVESNSKEKIIIHVKQLSDAFSWPVEEILLHLLKSIEDKDLIRTILRQFSVSISGKLECSSDLVTWILTALKDPKFIHEFGTLIQEVLCRNISSFKSRDLPIVYEICRVLKICSGEPSYDDGRKPSSVSVQRFLPFSHHIVAPGQSNVKLSPSRELFAGISELDRCRRQWIALCSCGTASEMFSGTPEYSFPAQHGHQLELFNPWLKYQEECLISWNKAKLHMYESPESSALPVLIQRALGSKDLDIILMIGLLSGFKNPINWINEAISRCREESTCAKLYAILGMTLYRLSNPRDPSNNFYTDLYLKCVAEKRLKDLGINDIKCYQIEKNVLIKKLIKNEKVTAAILQEIGSLFNFDSKMLFLAYLKHLILSWTPKYTVKLAPSGKEEYTVTNSVDHILKTFEYIRHGIDKEEMVAFILTGWHKVNFYYYEVYDAILEMLITLDSSKDFVLQQKEMIRFLYTYRRSSKPTEVAAFGDMRMLPEIAKWRLPLLTAISECTEMLIPSVMQSFAERIMGSEVNFQNYSKWINGPPVENFNQSSLCVLAIKQGINSQLKEYNASEKWQWYKTEELFLKNVWDCTNRIDNLKLATAIVKYLITKLPPGVDQLMAAEMCLSLAKRWHESSEDEEESRSVLELIEAKYLQLSVMNILYMNGLGEDKHLEFVKDPEQLITSLYFHKTDFGVAAPDKKGYGVNSAAEAIANLYSIQLINHKLNLISTWLFPKEEEDSILGNSFFDGESFARERKRSLANAEEMRRLFYICKSLDENLVMRFIMSTAFADTGDRSISNLVKFRAILCMRIVDYNKAEALLSMVGIEDLGEHVKKLELVIPLERMGILHSVNEFDSSDLPSIAKRILEKDPNLRKNVVAASKFCLANNIFQPNLWSLMLDIMIRYSMVPDLFELLPLMTVHSVFIYVSNYRTAWKEVLEGPFTKAKIPMTFEEEEKCSRSLSLLHLCPIATDIDIEGIAANCLKRSKAEFASLLLPFHSTIGRAKLRKQILGISSFENLKTQLTSLSKKIQVCINEVLTILKD